MHHNDLDSRAVAAARAIPAVVVQAKGNGHAGTAMALAPLMHTLFQRVLRHDPADPAWPGRDIFVLSAGHASLALYVQLYLCGYGLTLDDLAASRKLRSRTPGHPELHHTPGVDMSTGPLGQGFASAVGMAIATRREEALVGDEGGLLARTVWAVAGDGCLEEGVASEAASLAGTLGLSNLVVVWDDNGITIDAPTTETFTEDVRERFRAYGWRVLEAEDPDDLASLEATLREARASDGRPTLVALRTVIGFPSAKVGGTPAAHAGGFGADEVSSVLAELGFAPDAGLADLVPDDVLAHTRAAVARGRELHAAWDRGMAELAERSPERRRVWRDLHDATLAVETDLAALDAVEVPGGAVATRVASGAAVQALVAASPRWFGGSADLAASTNVAVPGQPVTAERPDGAFVRFGVREHAMAAALSGMALAGPWRPYGSTYAVFSDYMRPAIRLAALMGLPVSYVFTHDSVAVGEDGPTHQPVEQVASLRTVPGLSVVRPADAAETLACWRHVVRDPQVGPVAWLLSRQAVPALPGPAPTADDVAAGARVVHRPEGREDVAVLASGSEVALALTAAERLAAEGVGVRVVSVPCVEWFTALDADRQEAILGVPRERRVAVEAGRGDAWYRWATAVVGVEEFGESGSGPEVMELRGMTADRVAAAVRGVLG
ncbi:transketolase family protein [Georgenia faecalis]|uniref:transketolase family protein n=1 Tax=Georgenia faecalis TaxID=2483799 RepID=UPI000FD7F1CC|nr:transketolase [Georgenia faecalis]